MAMRSSPSVPFTTFGRFFDRPGAKIQPAVRSRCPHGGPEDAWIYREGVCFPGLRFFARGARRKVVEGNASGRRAIIVGVANAGNDQ